MHARGLKYPGCWWLDHRSSVRPQPSLHRRQGREGWEANASHSVDGCDPPEFCRGLIVGSAFVGNRCPRKLMARSADGEWSHLGPAGPPYANRTAGGRPDNACAPWGLGFGCRTPWAFIWTKNGIAL